MRILHTFWQPASGDDFARAGALHLWAETAVPARQARRRVDPSHPFALAKTDWPAFLELLGVPRVPPGAIETCRLRLPSVGAAPLPSPQLARFQAADPVTDGAQLCEWQVDSYRLDSPVRQLRDIHYQSFHHADSLQPGADFLFWFWFTQELKHLLLRDQYLPRLVWHRLPKAKGQRKPPPGEVLCGWQWTSDSFDELIARALPSWPAAAATGLDGPVDPESLLRHCSEVLLDQTLRQVRWPATFTRRIEGTLLAGGLDPARAAIQTGDAAMDLYRRWRGWRRCLVGADRGAAFSLGLRLVEAPPERPDDWRLDLIAVPKDDPSHRLDLADYWAEPAAGRQAIQQRFGADFERDLLFDLGLAARIYPRLWAGLETATPQAVPLDLDGAFDFLKETAWVLEDAGFKVVVPAWWTPQGRRRIKIRLRPTGQRGKLSAAPTQGGLSLDHLIQYRYELAIGDQTVTEDEWRQLVEAKTPLVQFRGQWVELDRDKMREMLAFWREHGQELPAIALPDLLRKVATDDSFEIDRDAALAEMLERLRDHRQLEPVPNPAGLACTLRDYQRRGVAWLGFLEGLGLHGCLADDMGLGKTMQVIARLLSEREPGTSLPPTLLIAPTSVLGNWAKEIQTFAPRLRTLIHHGPDRAQATEAFHAQVDGCDMVITSYALVRRDLKLLGALTWHRVVLDEAQNIKNPKAEQTKAILKLEARHRLALTGTPVENRLTDLWSIFHFVQPGYLDTQARFRKQFEIPIQRDKDPGRTMTLKRLVEPFILRRVKTDKSIIADLPDKVEGRQYCNLSKEQAALYESVVRDVERRLDEKEGIERQGLMLSTLMRLKQICNHPAQFLKDGSPFTPERSHKLQRLDAMLDEVMATGDSVLVFSQFTEIGAELEQFLRRSRHYRTYYLHGGTPRTRREAMIEAFQDPETEPAVFVLSLKAGGVGITLTKANHVFHFDRWWNPAVENQASDRAFRIGQVKQDPFLLFELRGLPRKRLHEALCRTPLGAALSGLLVEDAAEPIEPAASFFTQPRPATTSPDYQAFWSGRHRLPGEIAPAAPAAVPAILIKKGGDFPPFWDKGGSFIELMEELYLRTRTKNKALE
ncbi:SNF2-related protein [Thioalkalicoccus limnaeus]|uniref:SNF2-related protein n=1 Tax=Thioalkalicoccus limnaeus TaxID=120681 RepID=A0ABV4BC71_9GAMM